MMADLSRELETPRLRLRPFALRDAEAMYALLRDPVVNTFLPWFPAQTLAEAEEMLRSRCIGGPGVHYAVCLRGEDAPIGYVSLAEGPAYDLGYGLARAHWGQGIPSEAAAAVLAEARRAGLAFVTATHDVHNPASGGVMRKIGMTYRYSYVERVQPKDQIVTFRLWQIDFAPEVPTYPGYWNTYPDHFVEEV